MKANEDDVTNDLEDTLLELAIEEIERNELNEKLWKLANDNAHGNESKARRLYIHKRIEQLTAASRKNPEIALQVRKRLAKFQVRNEVTNEPDKNLPVPASRTEVSQSRQSDEKFCASCATTIHASAQSCPKCGAAQNVVTAEGSTTQQPLLSEMKYCVGCGKQVHKTSKSCPNCGAAISGHPGGSTKSKTTAILLALFLGGFGAHKFYLNQPGLGVLYLLFFWTWIPAIVALIEIFIYASMSQTDFETKYGE